MRNKLIFKIIVLITITGLLTIGGCRKKPTPAGAAPVTINYYKLFDDTNAIQPIINDFQKQFPHITIKYKKFTDPQEYEDLIVNEIAEGSGPDIFSLPNTWIQANYKKITPAPADIIPEDAFSNTLLDIAYQDLVYNTGPEGQKEVYALPLTIDTLALYYNKDHFEKRIPERGKPATTWEEFKQDILKLRRLDNSNKVILSAAAIGRADNVARATDIIYTLFLQNGVNFYNRNGQNAIFNNGDGKKVADFYTEFAKPNTATYTWDQDSINGQNKDEIDKFVRGELSMMFGYSHLYKDIIDRIKIAERNNQNTIEPAAVRITTMPQINNNQNDQLAYAHYFAETVSRTSKHPREAWTFLKFMINQQNLTNYYNNGGFKPTSRRDLINSQSNNAIYRPFIQQLGFARTLPIVDEFKYKNILETAITEINNGIPTTDALNKAQTQINQLIPSEGVFPPQK